MKRKSVASVPTATSKTRLSCFPVADEIERGCSRQASITSFFAAKSSHKLRTRKVSAVGSDITSSSAKENNNLQTGRFLSTASAPPLVNLLSASSSTASLRRIHPSKPHQQTYLDFGQQSFGKKTLCPTCGMLYDERLDDDSKHHFRICQNYTQGVPFQAEAARAIVAFDKSSSIIEIRPTDSYGLRSKVAQVRAIVDAELGFAPSDINDMAAQRWTYLYVRNKRVVGLASAEPIRHAYLLLDNNFARSQVKQKALVGIHQMWVHSKFRRQGIASRLVDAVREKMMYGCVIPRAQVAFSSPTLAGAAFGRRYTASASSSQVLVYDCK